MRQEVRHFVTFLFPKDNRNITTNDVLTLLSHIPTEKAKNKVTTKSQLSSELDKQHFTYIYTVYHEKNK